MTVAAGQTECTMQTMMSVEMSRIKATAARKTLLLLARQQHIGSHTETKPE